MSDAYRTMPEVLGEEERETAAVQAYGQWRDRVRMLALLGFAVGGLVPAGLAAWFTSRWMLDTRGYASPRGAAIMLVLAWGVFLASGALVGRWLVRRWSPARVAALASDYEIPPHRITQTTDLLRDL